MGTNVLGDAIKTALDSLPEADKLDRTEVMRALGNEVEDWHEENPSAGGFHDKDFLGEEPASDDEFHIYDLSFGGYKKVLYSRLGGGAHDHDDRYYTETELNNGQLDNLYYTETEIDDLLTGYLEITAKAADSELLDNHDSAYFAISTHLHTGVYLPIAGKAADSEKLDNHDSTYFSIDGHNHNDLYFTETELNAGQLNNLYYTETEINNLLALYFKLADNEIVTGRPSFNGGVTGSTPPFYVDSTYKVTNLNADLLDGYNAQVAAGGNTVVLRHSAGYIFANYFNTTPNDVTTGVTKVCIESGNDGYIRHGTQAAIRTFIGAGSGNGLDADLLDGLHANEIGGGGAIKIGNSSRSTAGDQIISGVGFEPSVIIFLAGRRIGATNYLSIGVDNGTIHMCRRSKGGVPVIDTVYSLNMYYDGTSYIRGYVSAIGSDGFTITWAKAGDPANACDYIYLCLS